MNAVNASKLDPALLEKEVNSFPTDSREVKAGELFFAFSQPEFERNGFNGDFQDAHRFIPQAFENGAIACVGRMDRFEEHGELLDRYSDRLIFVDDVILAFQQLAHNVYLRWGGPVVAITGSAGKTTAKELAAHVLEHSGRRVLKNTKNLNNGLGHPMTVLQLAADEGFEVAVLEMGMSTPNREIERLCRITPPDIAVELNVLPVHIEHLGTIERIQEAKAELVKGLKKDGTAILNADDPRVLQMTDIHTGRVITYAIDRPADVSASAITTPHFDETHFRLATPDGDADATIRFSGRHNVSNALAAACVGHCFGMSATQIATALASKAPPAQRGEVIRFQQGFTVLNDSYNSNPDALLKMVRTLVEGAPEGSRKIVVAGEMLELGDREKEIHAETGKKIAEHGVDVLIGVRGLARTLVESAEEAGQKNAAFCEISDAAGELLCGEVRSGDVILVKGSRGVRTEIVVEKLLERFPIAAEAA